MTPGSAWGTLFGARDSNQVGCMQGKYLNLSAISQASLKPHIARILGPSRVCAETCAHDGVCGQVGTLEVVALGGSGIGS